MSPAARLEALFSAGGPVMWPLTGLGLVLGHLLVRRALILRTLRREGPARGPIERARQRDRVASHQALILTLIAAAPLLGLLGTVGGMITTFDALTDRGDPREGISGGIAAALTTTQLGLAVAIPGVITERLLNLRARRIAERLAAAEAP